MKISTMIKEINKMQEAVAAERDKLDELIGEMESLREDCANAWHSLQDARDSLSEMV